ncbi:MAG TPA: tetratricopeptide repeat protein [Gemmataceae bacterium]|nr:tetratricopeptide repeat protein [Gemmataceae bacterium]
MPAMPARHVFRAAVLVLLIGLGFAGVRLAHWLAPRPIDTSSQSTEPPDPRRAYAGPYRNIHPDVRYVGDDQCAGCHDDLARSFARHPMGRSLVPVESQLDRPGALPPSAWEREGPSHNSFSILGRRFEVERQGKQLWHRQAVLDDSGKPAVELSLEVRWVIGSGAKGYSYLFERDGYLFQTPISWFAQQQRWDLSPGFGPQVLTGRLVPASCLFCHADRIEERAEQSDRFVSPVGLRAIGCERCHGPGERHIRSGDRWDIVNPTRLAPRLRDAVCEQCHLEGEARVVRAGRKLFDYRPGLPLHDFWAVLVQGRQNGEDTKAVNHVEQMYQSKCFSHPVGDVQLGCTTCHDPHVHIGPAQRQTHYRAKCLKCHDGTKELAECSEPLPRRKRVNPQDSCIDCHMPRYRSWDIAHTATTDHRIIRRPPHQPNAGTDAQPPSPPDLNKVLLVDFYRDRFPQGDPQAKRSLGLGLLKMMQMNMLPPQQHAYRALRLLESALGEDPSDSSVRQGKVEAYLLLNQSDRALSEAEELVPQQPGNFRLLVQAACAAQSDKQMDRALDYWRRAVEINPFVADYQVRLLEVLIRTEQWDEARKHCEQLLRFDPFNVMGLQTQVGFLLRQGQRDEARRVFDILRKLKPADLAQREAWFQQQMR